MLSVFEFANPVRKIVRLKMINRPSGFLKCPMCFSILAGVIILLDKVLNDYASYGSGLFV